ncbi:hypothetical protein QTP86_033847 [Hemibagrus guttatus]|nr:hypothetical protein QTP86_033847 [Hemibagrus guttatus]
MLGSVSLLTHAHWIKPLPLVCLCRRKRMRIDVTSFFNSLSLTWRRYV